MPELPEVETVRRAQEPVCVGQKILSCDLHVPALRFPFADNFVQSMEGQVIEAILRRGKYMVLRLSSGQFVIWHLGMSGRVVIAAFSESYERQKHDHVLLRLGNEVQIIYNDARRFGFMTLCPGDWQEESPFNRMGPEPLSNNFSGDVLYQALQRKKTSPIKNALLDQSVVAGLGNIYVCEALFQSRISPLREARSVSLEACASLAQNIVSVLQKALLAGGSSLKDFKHADGSLGYFQHNFSVYDRQGLACPDCQCDMMKAGGVQRIVQSGRSSFYCPTVQK